MVLTTDCTTGSVGQAVSLVRYRFPLAYRDTPPCDVPVCAASLRFYFWLYILFRRVFLEHRFMDVSSMSSLTTFVVMRKAGWKLGSAALSSVVKLQQLLLGPFILFFRCILLTFSLFSREILSPARFKTCDTVFVTFAEVCIRLGATVHRLEASCFSLRPFLRDFTGSMAEQVDLGTGQNGCLLSMARLPECHNVLLQSRWATTTWQVMRREAAVFIRVATTCAALSSHILHSRIVAPSWLDTRTRARASGSKDRQLEDLAEIPSSAIVK